jgi:hypothetical protein
MSIDESLEEGASKLTSLCLMMYVYSSCSCWKDVEQAGGYVGLGLRVLWSS